MKLIYTALMAAFGVAGTSPALIDQGSATAVMAETYMDGWHPKHFRLSVLGQDETCAVELGDTAALTLDPKCSRLFQPLSEARFWQEQPNGDILLVTVDGRTIAQFFQGDGVAYESVEPAAPLMTLSEL